MPRGRSSRLGEGLRVFPRDAGVLLEKVIRDEIRGWRCLLLRIGDGPEGLGCFRNGGGPHGGETRRILSRLSHHPNPRPRLAPHCCDRAGSQGQLFRRRQDSLMKCILCCGAGEIGRSPVWHLPLGPPEGCFLQDRLS